MNIRELIDALLEHNESPTTEVRIEVNGKSVAAYRVNSGRHGGYKVLKIEPDEDLITIDDAQDSFMTDAD